MIKIMRGERLLLVLLVIFSLAGCSKEISDDENPAQKIEAPLDHLIIQEICYLGSPQRRKGPNGQEEIGRYDYDPYVKIYNPTEETQYLDGLLLVNTAFGSDTGMPGVEDVLEKFLMVNTAVKFPGSGKDYPIEPGKYVLVTGMAIDHTKPQGDPDNCLVGKCASSYDLTGADFQWVTSERMKNEEFMDKDPDVPHMILMCSDGKPTSNPMDQPFQINETLIALVRLGVDESSLKDKAYRWKYEGYDDIGHKSLTGVALKLPMEWVIDGVNLCPTEQFKRDWFKKVDVGYTGIRARNDNNSYTHLGKAVMRKHDGRNYVDTNNSTVDFEVKRASMAKEAE